MKFFFTVCLGLMIMDANAQSETNLQKPQKIAFYLQSGVEVLDFAGPMEVFAYAGFEVFTVSKTKEPIVSQGILKIIPDYSIDDAPQADILAFFGGNGLNTAQDRAITNWVKDQKNTEYFFSVCTGAFILAESGVLSNQTATTFHDALDLFESKYPDVKVLKNARFVDNGKVITTAGISAGIDGALHMVAKFKGFNAARKVAYYMEYDKWVPGEGLILSKDNPYVDLPKSEDFDDYLGVYEFLDGGTLELKLDTRENSLYAQVQDRDYPLFYLGKDLFQNVNGNDISFIRNKQGQVVSFKSEKDGEFKKLN